MKLSETSLFAELVKDRQRRELAMKCLNTQKNNTKMDDNEIVEILDSDNDQNNTKKTTKMSLNHIQDDVDSSLTVEIVENKNQTSKLEVESSLSNIKPIIESPIVFKDENIIKTNLTENKHCNTLSSNYSPYKETSPDSENKILKKSIKDLPLPPGEFSSYIINITFFKFLIRKYLQWLTNIFHC